MFLGVFSDQYALPGPCSRSRDIYYINQGPPLNGNMAATVDESKFWYYRDGTWDQCIHGFKLQAPDQLDEAMVLLARGLRQLPSIQQAPDLIKFTNLILAGDK